MIERGAHKSILEDDYKQHRAIAEEARGRDQTNLAATHYRKCADLLREIAELETSERLIDQRRALAKNLDSAATALKEANEHDSTVATEDETSEVGPTDDQDEWNTRTSSEETDTASEATAFLEAPPELDFNDVGGMTELKQTLIDTVIDPLERPELYEQYNLGVVNGIFLYGPPGTGKTYVARALAGELDYNFIEVTPTDLTSSLVGEAANNIADLFAVARENQPCVVFIDEIDAIAGQRSGGAQQTQSERQMVNQLLTELSEIQDTDIVVITATNLISEVDDALKRSGRFDKLIEIPPPDGTAREAILRIHLRNRPVLHEEINWEKIKKLTNGYTASDVELIANTAARRALKEAREQDNIQPLTQSHLETAIKQTESSLADWYD